MKYLILLMALALLSCTGSLTDEQRKKIRESMEQGAIKKVSEAQITEAAFQFGRKITQELEDKDKSMSNVVLFDSLAAVYRVEIIPLQLDNPELRSVERELLEAYIATNGSDDNVQESGVDSLIYTKPILTVDSNGGNQFLRAIGIRMTRKQIVLSIKE